MNIELLRAQKLHNSVKIIEQANINETIKKAKEYSKKRLPILLNRSFSEIPQRFVNCLTLSTYVRPHKHTATDGWELISWIDGIINVIFFDEKGEITQTIKMSSSDVKVIEIPPNVYHTLNTPDYGVYLEIRNCAYDPESDRTYASWSSVEEKAQL